MSLKIFLCSSLILLVSSNGISANKKRSFKESDTVSILKNNFGKNIAPFSTTTFNYKMVREDNKVYGAGPGAIVKSLILPGWGLSTTCTDQTKNFYFVLTPLSYGLIIYGFSQKIGSNKLFKEYAASKDQKTMDDALKQAYDKRQSFLNTVGAGVAIYVFQAGATFIWGKYNDVYRERQALWRENVAFNVSPYYDLRIKSAVVNTSVCFKFNKRKKNFTNPF